MKLTKKLSSIIACGLVVGSVPTAILSSCANNNNQPVQNSFSLTKFTDDPTMGKLLTIENGPIDIYMGERYTFNIDLSNWESRHIETKAQWSFLMKTADGASNVSIDEFNTIVRLDGRQLTAGEFGHTGNFSVNGLGDYWRIPWNSKIEISVIPKKTTSITTDTVKVNPYFIVKQEHPDRVDFNLNKTDTSSNGLVADEVGRTQTLLEGIRYTFHINLNDWDSQHRPASHVDWSFCFLDSQRNKPLSVIDFDANIIVKNGDQYLKEEDDYVLNWRDEIIGIGDCQRLSYDKTLTISLQLKNLDSNGKMIDCYPIFRHIDHSANVDAATSAQGEKIDNVDIVGKKTADWVDAKPQQRYTFTADTTSWPQISKKNKLSITWGFCIVNINNEFLTIESAWKAIITVNGTTLRYNEGFDLGTIGELSKGTYFFGTKDLTKVLTDQSQISIEVPVTNKDSRSGSIKVRPIFFDVKKAFPGNLN